MRPLASVLFACGARVVLQRLRPPGMVRLLARLLRVRRRRRRPRAAVAGGRRSRATARVALTWRASEEPDLFAYTVVARDDVRAGRTPTSASSFEPGVHRHLPARERHDRTTTPSRARDEAGNESPRLGRGRRDPAPRPPPPRARRRRVLSGERLLRRSPARVVRASPARGTYRLLAQHHARRSVLADRRRPARASTSTRTSRAGRTYYYVVAAVDAVRQRGRAVSTRCALSPEFNPGPTLGLPDDLGRSAAQQAGAFLNPRGIATDAAGQRLRDRQHRRDRARARSSPARVRSSTSWFTGPAAATGSRSTARERLRRRPAREPASSKYTVGRRVRRRSGARPGPAQGAFNGPTGDRGLRRRRRLRRRHGQRAGPEVHRPPGSFVRSWAVGAGARGRRDRRRRQRLRRRPAGAPRDEVHGRRDVSSSSSSAGTAASPAPEGDRRRRRPGA